MGTEKRIIDKNLTVGFLKSNTLQDVGEIVVYEHLNFDGEEWRTNLGYSYVGDDWNDKISSILIQSGTWEFFEHRDFQGASFRIGAGYYPELGIFGNFNDTISSFRQV